MPASQRRARSGAAVRRLVQLPEYRRAKTVAVFLSFGSEIETQSLIRHAWKKGKTVLIPMCDQGLQKAYFVPYMLGDAVTPTMKGPFELIEKRAPYSLNFIDFVLVPGLAFDVNLHRLGYGGGVYDRLLAKAKRAVHAGLFFDVQELTRVPVAAHDRRLALVVTDKRVLRRPRH